MSGHTPEPWAERQEIAISGKALNISMLLGSSDEVRVKNARDNLSRMRICVNAMAGIDDPVSMMAGIEDVLTRVSEYMSRYSDVNDGDYGEPEANKEMTLLSAIKPLLSKIGGAA